MSYGSTSFKALVNDKNRYFVSFVKKPGGHERAQDEAHIQHQCDVPIHTRADPTICTHCQLVEQHSTNEKFHLERILAFKESEQRTASESEREIERERDGERERERERERKPFAT